MSNLSIQAKLKNRLVMILTCRMEDCLSTFLSSFFFGTSFLFRLFCSLPVSCSFCSIWYVCYRSLKKEIAIVEGFEPWLRGLMNELIQPRILQKERELRPSRHKWNSFTAQKPPSCMILFFKPPLYMYVAD